MAGVTPLMLGPISLINGTAIAVTATSGSIYASSLIIQSVYGNTGAVYWGSASCTTSNGIRITPTNTYNLVFDKVYGTNGKIDLSKIYLDTETTGNQVNILYFQWDGF